MLDSAFRPARLPDALTVPMQETSSLDVILVTEIQDDANSLQLQAVDLCCVRGDQTLFNHLDFTLDQGEILEVQGRNGCGKTSLLQILCGLGHPELGEVRWCGNPILEQRSTFAKASRYIGHSNGCKLDLSPVENLRYLGALTGQVDERRIEDALERVGLGAHSRLPLRRLSAGQRRRTALARLLIDDASLWILDEPFTALDVAARRVFAELIMEHSNRGGITVLTAHESSGLSDRRCLVIA